MTDTTTKPQNPILDANAPRQRMTMPKILTEIEFFILKFKTKPVATKPNPNNKTRMKIEIRLIFLPPFVLN